ncbi:MAG: hypothetical protein AAF512_10125 [Pseudomonadota bacterium]
MMPTSLEKLQEHAAHHTNWQDVLADTGEVFAVFDENTQDSGNLSFGWLFQEHRYFVKTAGYPEYSDSINTFGRRCHWLRQAAGLAQACPHSALPAFYGMLDIENIACPLLLYDWRPGELINVPAEQREAPESSYQRFLHLSWQHRLSAMDQLLQLHVELDALDYVIVDLYDGSLLYDFIGHQLTLIDLDMYHVGPLTNTLGRWWGSTRFMAPEELQQGETIDRQTSVFTLGRFLRIFLLDNVPNTLQAAEKERASQLAALTNKACAQIRKERFDSPTTLFNHWQHIYTGNI